MQPDCNLKHLFRVLSITDFRALPISDFFHLFIHSFIHSFSIPEIQQSGYRTCH